MKYQFEEDLDKILDEMGFIPVSENWVEHNKEMREIIKKFLRKERNKAYLRGYSKGHGVGYQRGKGK